MRQLLIVNSAKALGAGGATPYDLSKLEAGALLIHELGASTALTTAPTKNFAIALGRANGQMPFLIPEVDVETLNVTKAEPTAGVKHKVVFTRPTPVVGKEYTLRFYRRGTVPHERNSWTVSIVAKTATAATEAKAFADMVNAKVSDKFRFKATASSATVTIEAEDYQAWSVIPIDGLATVSLTINEGPLLPTRLVGWSSIFNKWNITQVRLGLGGGLLPKERRAGIQAKGGITGASIDSFLLGCNIISFSSRMSLNNGTNTEFESFTRGSNERQDLSSSWLYSWPFSLSSFK